MSMQKFAIKNNRHLAVNTDEIIALDYNESMKEIRLVLRGGGILIIDGKKAAKIWNKLSSDLPNLLEEDANTLDVRDEAS